MCYKFTHVTYKNVGKNIVFRRSQRRHGSRSLDSAAGRSIYWLSCGIRFHEGVKKYEEKMCGNDVNRNNDRIFSWLWKLQGQKR